MKKNNNGKKMKTDEWNERNRNSEDRLTKEEDNDWNEKEDEEKDDNGNDFHEEVYDK